MFYKGVKKLNNELIVMLTYNDVTVKMLLKYLRSVNNQMSNFGDLKILVFH